MVLHKIFPKIVYESFYIDHDNFRKTVLDTIHMHCNMDGQTSEGTGHVNIHLDAKYRDFYKFVSSCIKDYVNSVNEVNPDNFNYHLVKSWFNASTAEDNPKHDHSDAHVSFVYYVNTPREFEKQLVFYSDFNPGSSPLDLFSGMQVLNSRNRESNIARLPTNQGTIYIFSSRLAHSVENVYNYEGNKFLPIFNQEDANKNRICIAGDFILTYKNVSSKHLGIQPMENWLTF